MSCPSQNDANYAFARGQNTRTRPNLSVTGYEMLHHVTARMALVALSVRWQCFVHPSYSNICSLDHAESPRMEDTCDMMT